MLRLERNAVPAVKRRARARCAHKFFFVIHSESSSLGIAWVYGKGSDFASSPQSRPEFEDLGCRAVRVAGTVFCHASGCSLIVDCGSLGIVATQRRERGHYAVLPKKTDADKVGAETAKILSVRIRYCGFGLTRSLQCFTGANKRLAVRSAERSEIN